MTGEYSLWIRWWNHNHSKSPDFYLFFWPCCTACGILVPQPGIKPMSPALKSWSFNHWTTSEVPMKSDFDNCAVVLWETTNNNQVLGAKFYLILWGPMDCSLSGSSVHEILQARILKWVVIPFSRGFCQPKNQIQVSSIAGGFFTIWAIIFPFVRESPCFFNNQTLKDLGVKVIMSTTYSQTV